MGYISQSLALSEYYKKLSKQLFRLGNYDLHYAGDIRESIYYLNVDRDGLRVWKFREVKITALQKKLYENLCNAHGTQAVNAVINEDTMIAGATSASEMGIAIATQNFFNQLRGSREDDW